MYDIVASLYRGPLPEVDKISINAFGAGAHAYFITHLDFDIIEGFCESASLGSTSDTGKLYLHRIAFEALLYGTNTYGYYEKGKRILEKLVESDKIIFLETNETVQVDLPEERIFVTALSAGYNAGSIMLLIETESGDRTLYTGKCRVTLSDLRSMTPLLNEDGTVKELKTVYLDTTFVRDHVQELPRRGEAMAALWDRMSRFIELDEKIAFHIHCILFADHFSALRYISEMTTKRVHVPCKLQELFTKCIPALEEAVNSSMCKHGENHSSFHFGCGYNDHGNCIRPGDWDVDFVVEEVTLHCNFTEGISGDEEMTWNRRRETIFCLHPFCAHSIYPENLSHFEAARMVNFLGISPSNVRPLYYLQNTTEDKVTDLLKRTCSSVKMEDFGSDRPSSFYDFTS